METRLEFSLKGFEYSTNGSACTSGVCPVTVLGASAAKFLHTPEHPCVSFSEVNYIGCGWSAAQAGLSNESLCYRIRCPAGCSAESNDTRRTCPGDGAREEAPAYLDYINGSVGRLVFASVCTSARAANVLPSAGGDFVVTLHSNITEPACDTAGASAPVDSSQGAQWLRFYAPIDAREGEWDPARETLIIRLRQDEAVPAGETISFSVANFSRAQGINAAGAGLSARVVIDDVCRVDDAEISVEPIGTVRNTSKIIFTPLAAGLPTAITVRFTPEAPIASFENILVRLNKFMALDVPRITGIYGPQGHKVWAQWSGDTFLLNVTVACGQTLPAHVPVEFTIPVSANISLPPFGIQGGTSDLTIEIVSAAGPIGEKVFDSTPSVGSFTTSTSLHFSLPQAGQESDMIFSFMGEMTIVAGEYVEVVLPDFLFNEGEMITNIEPNGTFSNGTWNQATESIRFTALRDVARQTPVTLTVLKESRSRIPLLGVVANQSTIKISTDAFDGSVSGLPLAFTQAVGFFTISELTFGNPRAGEVTSLHFRFRPNMQMENGERIKLELPRFTGASVESIAVESVPAGRLVLASWDLDSVTLTLTVGGPTCAETVLFANEILTVEVPASAGITLPQDGVRLDESVLVSANETVSGPVLPGRVLILQAVGSFLTWPHYIPRAPDLEFSLTEPTEITIRFQAQMHLDPNETVTFHLPLFSSSALYQTALPAAVSPTVASNVHFSWNLTTESLVLHVGPERIPKLTNVTAVIAPEAGIYLPIVGLKWNNTNITMSSDAADGPTRSTSIVTSNAVGRLWGDKLGVKPPLLGL